jgi:hypothetical protein
MDRKEFERHVEEILDHSIDIVTFAEQMVSHWSYDLYSRKPGAAYAADGVFKGTDLDLACFLSALVDRGAVINLPKYKSRRARTVREGEHIVSKDNRHGKIKGLVSNKSVFSFGLRIEDMNVMTTDSVGADRSFMVVDIDGTWYEGWKVIEFLATAKENDWLSDKKLWDGQSVSFDNFVHPMRKNSFYGRYYWLTKMLVERLGLEAKHLSKEVDRLKELGYQLPSGKVKEWPKTKRGESESITVVAFEAEVEHPPFMSEFRLVEESDDGLLTAFRRIKAIRYGIIPKLSFAARATEYAFHLHGREMTVPKKIEGSWDGGYREKGKKKVWNRLPLNGGDLFLRWRDWTKSERVAKSS